ncbi:MAG: hypothetical protein IKZ30_00365, partial [Oscillospiraceae bacterium]|nr:hypothetical protein [Oscillospiraceae bacterium]
ERELKALREKQLEYQMIEIYRMVEVRPTRDPERDKVVLEMETEHAVRSMVEQIIRHGAVEISKTHIFNPMWPDIQGYKFTLRALKRRF